MEQIIGSHECVLSGNGYQKTLLGDTASNSTLSIIKNTGKRLSECMQALLTNLTL